MISACLIVFLCVAAYIALLTHSAFIFCVGITALICYIVFVYRLLRNKYESRPRVIAAGIAAPFVWAVMLFLSYNAQVGLPLACAIACAAGISVWVLVKG